jgi:hypothetical protein
VWIEGDDAQRTGAEVLDDIETTSFELVSGS